jgi:hypothetical protein
VLMLMVVLMSTKHHNKPFSAGFCFLVVYLFGFRLFWRNN